jgi:Zn-finger nucleic acid-binding protein
MDSDTTALVQLELKYCERCGGLWLRRHIAEGAYCRSCAVILEDFPTARTLPPWRRRKAARQCQRRPRPAHLEGATV